MTRKNIQSFIDKMKENQDGTISGGFGSLRGGGFRPLSTNTSCTNTGSACSGNNTRLCQNELTCSGNNNLDCSNTGTCS